MPAQPLKGILILQGRARVCVCLFVNPKPLIFCYTGSLISLMSLGFLSSGAPCRRQKGNALFLILIAVALFAAVSYAVTQSGRGGADTSKETMRIDAVSLTEYAAQLRTAVTRMLLTGTSFADLEFCSPADGACAYSSGVDEFCATGANCVFAPEGGGAPKPSAAITGVPGFTLITLCKDLINIQGVGTTANDIVFSYSFLGSLDATFCSIVNQGLHGDSTEPVVTTGIGANAWKLMTCAPVDSTVSCVTPSECDGKASVCVDLNTGTGSIYYHVLSER